MTSTTTEGKDDSAHRIQQLRERLELYNNTIAETMNAISGANAGAAGASATKASAATATATTITAGSSSSPLAGVATAARAEGRSRENSASSSAGNTRPIDSFTFAWERVGRASPLRHSGATGRYTSTTAAGAGVASAAKATTSVPVTAPRLDRNLAKEFTETSPPPRERAAAVTRAANTRSSPLSPTPPAPEPSATTRHADPVAPTATPSPPAPAAAGTAQAEQADSDGYVVEERIVEEEVTDTDVETSSQDTSGTTTTSTTDDDEEEGEDSFDFDQDSEDEEFEAFLRDVMEDSALRYSLESALSKRFHIRGGNAELDDDDAARAARLGTRQGQLEESMRLAQEHQRRAAHRGGTNKGKGQLRSRTHATGPSLGVETSTSERTTTAASSATSKADTSRATPEERAAPVNITANPEADALVSFDSLETGFYRLRSVLKSSTKILNSLGVDEFPAPLPLMERYTTVLARRESLAKEEQALRANPPEGHSLAEVRAMYAVPMDEQARGIIAGCQGLLAQLKVVEERRAAVEQKKHHLAEREASLQERRTARQGIKEEIEQLQRSIERGNERAKGRETHYNTRLDEHSARERDIQGRISEVEALGKKVSWWLRILEERDGALSTKEEKLRRVQQDLLRRSDNLASFKKLTGKMKQPPPPPPRVGRP